jgi:hypothetical protein
LSVPACRLRVSHSRPRAIDDRFVLAPLR